ncbi:zinc finger TRAF-type-containing protein 1-B-like [Culicoides brevitarsis]|uniref:zinc finger TRAF-type-containing protein 1-B-like n=1 Tax=Culicoides brevitarsis TaxID=469753 RepID=UPI00307C8D0F
MNFARNLDSGNSSMRFCHLAGGNLLGLHLSRAVWDPYPWVSDVTVDSSASKAGIKVGDLLLEVNGEDILGQNVSEVAQKIKKSHRNEVTLLLWNSGAEHNHWNQNSVPRFAGCMQRVAQLLECPICLDTVRRPIVQCINGHLLCSGCRNKTQQCPVCRVSLESNTSRCLVAEKLLGLIVETFKNKINY